MIYVIIATVIAVIIGGLATANNSGGPMVGALLLGMVTFFAALVICNTCGML